VVLENIPVTPVKVIVSVHSGISDVEQIRDCNVPVGMVSAGTVSPELRHVAITVAGLVYVVVCGAVNVVAGNMAVSPLLNVTTS